MDMLLCAVVGVVLLIVVVVAIASRDHGLSPKHHSELNKVLGVDPARYSELRDKYAGDKVAQHQIDRYDGSSEYNEHLCALRDAYKANDAAAVEHENQWFEDK